MAELSKIFKSNDLYEAWRDNKDIPSNVIAVVLDKTGEDVQKVAIGTNNIDGEYKTYEVAKGEEPTGTINITENGENIDVKQYAKANVAVPQPSGNIDITQNGEGIDIAQYATANVKIPTVTTIEPILLTTHNSDEYTLPERKSLITLNEGEYVLDGDIITYTVDIDFDSAVLANENLAIIAKQGNNILPITVQRKGKFPAIFTLTASYDIVDGSYITLYYYVASDNYKLCTIGIN